VEGDRVAHCHRMKHLHVLAPKGGDLHHGELLGRASLVGGGAA